MIVCALLPWAEAMQGLPLLPSGQQLSLSLALGASEVVLSDGGSEALLDLARQNARDDRELSEATAASGGRRRAGDVNMEASGDGSVEIDAEDEEEAEEGAPACISAANGFRERARYLRTLREVRANDPFFAKEAAAANVTTDAAAGGGRRTGVKMAASDATSDAASGDAVAGADGNDPTLNPLPDEAFEVRTSIDPRRGQGLFARRHVEAGRFLFDYEGEV